MSRFYFHVRQGDHRFDDAVGTELPDLRAAWEHAICDARRLIDEEVLEGEIDTQWIEIGDATGAIIASLPFARTTQQLH